MLAKIIASYEYSLKFSSRVCYYISYSMTWNFTISWRVIETSFVHQLSVAQWSLHCFCSEQKLRALIIKSSSSRTQWTFVLNLIRDTFTNARIWSRAALSFSIENEHYGKLHVSSHVFSNLTKLSIRSNETTFARYYSYKITPAEFSSDFKIAQQSMESGMNVEKLLNMPRLFRVISNSGSAIKV